MSVYRDLGVSADTLPAFLATPAGYQAKTVEHKLCPVRSFLRFACDSGLVDEAVLEAVPAAKSTRQARSPSVWDPAEVTKILQAVDRGNPCGKRDYAIILLITRLGLRGIDVKRLRFGDLDWPGNRLSASLTSSASSSRAAWAAATVRVRCRSPPIRKGRRRWRGLPG